MAVSLFTFVDLYARLLTTGAHVLNKGVEFAKGKEVDPETILDWRLIDDMQPLRFQIGVLCNFSKQWTARVADLPVAGNIPDSLPLAGLYREMDIAKAYLAALRPEQFAGRDDVQLTVAIGDGSLKPTLTCAQWLTVFATTNLYFHATTAYDILRARGVPLGKIDMFASGF